MVSPSCAATVNGTGYQTIYQYLGMENDGFAYYGGGQYYNPVMGRTLSPQRPLSSSGGYGSAAAPIAAAMGAAGGGGNPAQEALQASADAAGFLSLTSITDSASAAAVASDTVAATAWGWAPYLAAGLEALDQILNFFGVFGGGSSGLPAWMVWRLNHQGGNLQEWAQINGVNPEIAPSWQPTAGGIQLVHIIAPFRRLPDASGQSPGPGWTQKGPHGNWFYPDTGHSLSPDPQHAVAKGGYVDLHRRGAKRELSLRMHNNELQFWTDGPDVWLPIEELPLSMIP